jgi:EAL domain-containing protein (putative c-di-GMP-specific phosphodiesterase class I)
VAPIKFIRVAEETGIIFELGMWVFRNACIQLHQWQRKKMPIKCLSVNFSARQLIMNDLAERVGAILTETGCDARLIEIEITETSMLFDLAAIKRVVSSLKRLGVRIAIDDFGTGFSSLSHLQQLDIDALKIDQSFVRDLLQDSGDAAITRTVISLGRGLGLKVIAEGVENQEQLAFLQRYDCDFYQGFHFSPAVPADQFEALLANSR